MSSIIAIMKEKLIGTMSHQKKKIFFIIRMK